jgi:hypothetical protein
MKMTIQKCFTVTIDTSKERKRIERCFNVKGRRRIYMKLMYLMDLIESEKWKEAERELASDWWQGRDRKDECPRLEYIGMYRTESDWDNYISLIIRMANYPDVYKVVKKK